VTASRRKDDMEPTLNEVLDGVGGVGGIVHEFPPLPGSVGSQLTDLDASNRSGWRIFLRFNRITGGAQAACCSASVNRKVRRNEHSLAAQIV
jgi:hypothetical protein